MKYKNDSLRARWWDYSTAASYFITICTKDKIPFFGEVVNGEMKLSPIGEIVNEEWVRTADIRSRMKLELHNFIVMPDHFHALITIGITEFNDKDSYLDEFGNFKNNAFKPQSNNLGSIVRGFKSAVTMRCKLKGYPFCWQSRYHDVIVRDLKQFENVQQYILDNPSKWKPCGEASCGDAKLRVPT